MSHNIVKVKQLLPIVEVVKAKIQAETEAEPVDDDSE